MTCAERSNKSPQVPSTFTPHARDDAIECRAPAGLLPHLNPQHAEEYVLLDRLHQDWIFCHSHTRINTACTAQVASTAAGVKLMSVFSRKRLLTVSAYTCAFSMMILATLYQVGVEVDEADPNAPIGVARRLPIVFIALYIIGFSVGLGPITWLLAAELVPMRNNGVFSALVAAFSWICAFLVTWFFERINETLQLSGVGLLFSALTFMGGLMVSFFMPETQNKTLEELLLEPHRKARDDAASVSSKGSGGSRRSKR
ncbi:hypothetical protein HPB49_015931 [Dermacentor silvarum]|uniref:Uncharacterized protein n=1 Tax=Dermacentor silvarum TaxID=543639 RepID=A0ACB8DJ20_DERSI|nr:hypothetical protein HPB49_015931 [Dermacentor silvarum]